MENNKIKELLDKVTLIREKYDEINKITGANYNVFNVLKLQSDEVRLHSRFIGDLLNPKGKHGRGSIFLGLFLKVIKCYTINIHNSSIKLEKPIDELNSNEKGRIDILIVDNKYNSIIIENKIYAKDQKGQLLKYYNYGDKKLNNFTLLYLNINGEPPTEQSYGSLATNKFSVISYREHILDWLRQCIKEIDNDSKLLNALKDYTYIIESLTGETKTNEMKNKIQETIITSKESYLTAKLINQQYLDIRKTISKNFRQNLDLKLKQEFNHIKFIKDDKYISQLSYSCANINDIKENILFQTSRLFEKNKKDINKSEKFYYGFRFNHSDNDNKKYNDIRTKIIDITSTDCKEGDSNKYWIAVWVFETLEEMEIQMINSEKKDRLLTKLFSELKNKIDAIEKGKFIPIK